MAVFVIGLIGAWRRWVLRPVLVVAAQGGNPAEIDRDVASRTLFGDPTEGSFIVYDCAPNEVYDRAGSLCSKVDLKAALARRLQPYTLDNDVFLDQVIRSGRLVSVLFELQGVETAAAGAVGQTVRIQKSALGPVRYSTDSQARRRQMFPHKELTGNF